MKLKRKKKSLLLGKKAMTKEDSILKIRDITLPTKVHIVKAVVFPIAMHRYESWTINKADHWRMDAFKLWCRENSWELLGQMEIKPVNPKENWPWIFIGRTDAEAPYFGLQMGRANSLEKTWCWERLKAGGEGRWDGWRASPTQWTWVCTNSKR